MGNYIGFGNWNKNYLFILANALSVILKDIITGFGYYTYKLELIKNNKFGGHTFTSIILLFNDVCLFFGIL